MIDSGNFYFFSGRGSICIITSLLVKRLSLIHCQICQVRTVYHKDRDTDKFGVVLEVQEKSGIQRPPRDGAITGKAGNWPVGAYSRCSTCDGSPQTITNRRTHTKVLVPPGVGQEGPSDPAAVSRWFHALGWATHLESTALHTITREVGKHFFSEQMEKQQLHAASFHLVGGSTGAMCLSPRGSSAPDRRRMAHNIVFRTGSLAIRGSIWPLPLGQ